MRALPEAVATQAELVRRTARPVPDRHAAPADPSITAQLVHACSLRRLVVIGYRHEDGPQWSSLVEPWAVVVRMGRWYLLSRRVSNGAVRTYRLDRIHSVDLQETTFEAPDGLDPVAELEQNFAVGWEFATEVEIQAPAEEMAGWLSPAIGRIEPIDATHCRLLGSTSDPAWYAEVLAGIPAPFTVVGGRELRHAVRALGERLIAAAGGR